MEIRKVLEKIREEDWYRGQIKHLETIEPKRKQTKEPESDLSSRVEKYLQKKDIKLFTHQARAFDIISSGENLILATPTASGKTLGFNLPILDDLLEDGGKRALYIYPAKALTNDQLSTLRVMENDLEGKFNPAVYDGDTPDHRKSTIRKNSRVILTNPYALHHYLGWHDKWSNFFENLSYIVIDEVHRYRGVFGSNVAWLLKRLGRICDNYGSDPQFVLSSATIANPEEHSRELTEKEFEIVTEDGSPRGKKFFLFWNTLEDPDRSPPRQTSDLLGFLVSEGASTLCFTVSRRLAELVSKWGGSKSTEKKIQSYRAGYRPEERREIERGLKRGDLKGVASTNALELGIDVGVLDTVIISGYPGTVISTWQQAGRAGRGKKSSAAVLIGYENPLDQYYINHPDKIFARDHESATIDVNNPNIALGGLVCASSELPIRKEEEMYEKFRPQLKALEREDVVRETPLGFVYSGKDRPAEVVRIDNISDEVYEVIKEDGEVLETMDKSQAFREAHQGAVLLHQGDKYVVRDFDLETKQIRVVQKEVGYHTRSISSTELAVLESLKSLREKEFKVHFGTVEVRENYQGYRAVKYGEVIRTLPLNLPPIEFETEALWVSIPQGLMKKAKEKGLDPQGGIHGMEHAMIGMVPVIAICDRWDVGGVSSPFHPDTEVPSIFIYDSYEGGVGITSKCFQLSKRLLKATQELISDCDCEDGCPSCIYSPKCGNKNEPLDKDAALFLISRLLGKSS